MFLPANKEFFFLIKINLQHQKQVLYLFKHLSTFHPRGAQMDTPKSTLTVALLNKRDSWQHMLYFQGYFPQTKHQKYFQKQDLEISLLLHTSNFPNVSWFPTHQLRKGQSTSWAQQVENSQHHHCKLPLSGQNRICESALCWNSVDKLFLPA